MIETTSGGGGAWDAIWESAGRLTDEGYVVEFSIPFSQLRFQKTTSGQTWGLSITRQRPRDRGYFLRTEARDRDLSCQRCQYSKITGFVGIVGGKNLEINPTITGINTDEREEIDEPLENTAQDVEFGVTALWGFRPNASLSATINPDFSQVEADAAQLGINQRFSLFFEEKRPFFLEGANYFETPINAVYTRTVVSPNWGAKITGKEGRNGFGVYVAEDDVTALLFPGTEESDREIFDEGHHTAVLRYRRDVGRTSSLGAIVTARSGDDYSNAVYGVDGMLRLGPSDIIRFQALGSQTEYPEEIREEYDQPDGTLEDTAFMANYFHDSERWLWGLYLEQFGEDFRADSGFVPQVGARALWGGLWRVWRGDDTSWYTRNSLGAEVSQSEDIDGNLLSREAEVGWSFSGGMRSNTRIEIDYGDEVVEGVSIPDQMGVRFRGSFWPSGNLEFGLHGRIGDQVDYANIQPGEQVRLKPWLTWRPGKHWEVNLNHEYRDLDVEGGRLFKANLSQMRLVYYLNVRTFVRAILQYTDVERNPALYEDEVEAHESRLFSQLLFSYKLNPRTVIFLGYSDTTNSDDSFNDVLMNRSVFIKLGYAWLL